MTTQVVGFLALIAGCPYLLGTGGLPSVSSSDSLYFGGETGTQLADGWLAPPPDFREAARPLDGDCEIDSLALKILDATISSGPGAGYPLASFLATRDSLQVVSSPLALAVSATTGSLTVGNGALFSSPSFAYLEQECVRITGIAGNVLTVTRGVLGTKAVVHTLAPESGLAPEVFASIPWAVHRKVTLWAVTDSGAAKLLWLGTTGLAPELSEDGASYMLKCQPLWQSLAESLTGASPGTLTLSGVSGGLFAIAAANIRTATNSAGGFTQGLARWRSLEMAMDSLAQDCERVINGFANVVAGSTQGFFRRDGANGIFTLDFTTTVAVTEIQGGLQFPAARETPLGYRQIDAQVFDRGGNKHALVWQIPNCPLVTYRIRFDGVADTFGCRSTLPYDTLTTIAAGTPSGGRALAIEKGLRLRVTDSFELYLGNVTTFGTYFTATSTLYARKFGETLPVDLSNYWVTDPPPVQVLTLVRCEHWADGLRYAVLPQISETVDADWNWDAFETLILRTRGQGAGREWALDGARTLGKLITESALLAGCSLAPRAGKLALVPWTLPDANSTPALTITETLAPVTKWSKWAEGLANFGKITAEGDTSITLEDSRSIRRYGKGRTLAIDLDGITPAQLGGLEPDTLKRALLSRLELWADPIDYVPVEIPITYLFDAYIGDTIALSDWIIPDGLGSRGVSGLRGTIVDRTLGFESGVLTLGVLIWRREAVTYGPAVQVLSNGSGLPAVDTVRLQALPVAGAADFAGGSVSGSDTFLVGDKVLLQLADSTTLFEESLTIAAITFDGTYYRFQFTGALSAPAQAYVTGGSLLWITLDHYTLVTASEKKKAYIASESTLLIDGAGAAQRIAP